MIRTASLVAAKATGTLSRRLGRGGGTTLPGRVLQAVDKAAVGSLASELSRGVAVVSATNGKTTTSTMIAAALDGGGIDTVHNAAGANLRSGVATALARSARLRRGMRGDFGLFELDEAALPTVIDELDPSVLVLCNLFRDQLDRYGELDTLADAWKEVVRSRPDRCKIILGGDDPLVAALGRGRPGVVYFGIDDRAQALPRLQDAADSKYCAVCGGALTYLAVYLGHLGDYECHSCGWRRPKLDVAGRNVRLKGTERASVTVGSAMGDMELDLPLPGLYNVYNGVAAAAVAVALAVPPDVVERSLRRFAPAFGRAESISIDGVPGQILLIKNPTGANEVLRTLGFADPRAALVVALNDNIADGRDVSWIWDADFEMLSRMNGPIVCTGTRASDMALRLKYAGVDLSRIVVSRDLRAAVDRAVAQSARSQRKIYFLPTYTALLELERLLAGRGATGHGFLNRARAGSS